MRRRRRRKEIGINLPKGVTSEKINHMWRKKDKKLVSLNTKEVKNKDIETFKYKHFPIKVMEKLYRRKEGQKIGRCGIYCGRRMMRRRKEVEEMRGRSIIWRRMRRRKEEGEVEGRHLPIGIKQTSLTDEPYDGETGFPVLGEIKNVR